MNDVINTDNVLKLNYSTETTQSETNWLVTEQFLKKMDFVKSQFNKK